MLWRLVDSWLAPPPDPARVGWLRQAVYAHRGWHGEGRAENSLAAFSAAIEAGLGIECDVQLSADGQAMVFHDWDLDRLTRERGAVRSRSAQHLVGISLAGTEDRISPLPALLAQVRGRVPLLIEIKSRRDMPFVPLCLAVRDALTTYAGTVAVMSFDPRPVRWFSRHAPDVVRGLVVSENGSNDLRGSSRRRLSVWQARPEFLAFDVRDLPSRFAARQRGRGLPLLTWTVSDSARAKLAARYADAPIAEAEGLEAARMNR